ncbi:SusC/RagA family TonB-linked outer membrane protein [Pedobacter sp. CFBP9032]|uniref:SusC/RagA family TonB-linked outer membrane protein n=1 Tax=Pedobacter sp. CFBP9032 TaxID=3096539 RepID=UPI002A69B190|nr:SusC/RagA family TonB-linked outer membrane protein [Pedobacter sp. CFBP9032]MDY0905154.1 SusC/RagA family TonB-linked outer membrane protein [Pedobacter sp. CFBP9032]
MKKLLQSLFILLFIAFTAVGQDRTISGTVTSADDKLPLPGVNVKIKGAQGGTVTGADGKFTVRTPSGATALEFSSIGFTTQTITIGTSGTVNVALAGDATSLSEVVVTGLGGARDQKALGYSVAKVDGDRLNNARITDVNTALAGKVAGVQLNGSPSSSFDNASIIIRGINGVSLGAPLFVIDGTPTTADNVNMDNVESLTVLKGAAAAALYGQRAYNGVVVITNKKGSRKPGTSVELNTGYTAEKAALLPDYQNEYAGGYTAEWPTFVYDPTIHPASWASFNGQKMLEYGADASFGPKIDGSQYRPYYSWLPGENFGKTVPITAQPDNIKDFLQTGGNFNTSIAFTTGGDAYNLRVGYTNQTRTLIQQNSNRNINIFNINGSYDISKKLTVSTDLQFSREERRGQPYEGYRNDGLNIVQGFNQWFQRQLDMKEMEANQTLPNGNPTSWNIGDPNGSGDLDAIGTPQYWDNPFWVANNNFRTARRNRIFGNLGLKYNITNELALQGLIRADVNTLLGDERMATGGLQQDYFKTTSNNNNEFNYELNATYKKSWGDFSFDALLGGNIRHERREGLNMETAGGLSFRNYFNIAASVARPITANTFYEKEVRSVYGKASLGYKGFLYLDVTGRNDWSSVFAPDLNSYFYPSVSGSFIASQFFPEPLKNIVSFAKLRASYAKVGSDLDPFQLMLQYNIRQSYGDNAAINIGDQLRDGRIKPALSGSIEVGTELKFLKDRIGIDFSYYKNSNKDQIISVTANGATGFSSNLINAGKLTNRGLELALTGTPIKSGNVSWDISVNYSRSRTIVDEITPDQDNVLYENSTFFGSSLNLTKGEEWGRVLGNKFNRDASGNMIIGASGQPTFSTAQFIGFARPRYNGGAFSSLRVYNFDFSFSLDFQKGGLFNSTTRAFNMGSGLSTETLGVNDKGIDWRLPVSQGGGYKFAGVLANGQPNNRYIEASSAFYTGMQNGSGEMFMIDASYLKLREVRLGYSVPTRFLKTKLGLVKSANLGLIVGNAWLISAPGKKYGVDPSELENFWQEGGQLPQTRTFGFNLRLGF